MRHPALLRTSIYSTEIQLILSRSKREHKVKDLLLHLVRAAIELINLIDHHNRFLTHLDSFLKHKSCLRHTALKRIYKEKYTISHIKHTLNLSTEVAMARSIDDIDLYTLIYYRHILRKNSDTSFSLKVIIIQDKLSQLLLLTRLTRLIDHPVHKSRLSMIDVGDDRNVSDFHTVDN